MDHKEKRPVKPITQEDIFFEPEEVACASELTGLIPAAIHTEEEAHAYEEIWPIHRQKPIS